MEHTVSNKIISLRLEKNAVFRVIAEVTENLAGVRSIIIDTLLSQQFPTHFGVCCVNIKAYRCNYKRISTRIV